MPNCVGAFFMMISLSSFSIHSFGIIGVNIKVWALVSLMSIFRIKVMYVAFAVMSCPSPNVPWFVDGWRV